MADLTADAPLRVFGPAYTHKFVLDTSAARTVYKGQPLIVDQNVDATGFLAQFVTAVVVASDDVFMGIAAEGKTVASGAAEDLVSAGIEAYIGPTILGFKSAVYTDGADSGKTIYMSDSGTLSSTASQNPVIGKLMWVEDGYAYVLINSSTVCSGA